MFLQSEPRNEDLYYADGNFLDSHRFIIKRDSDTTVNGIFMYGSDSLSSHYLLSYPLYIDDLQFSKDLLSSFKLHMDGKGLIFTIFRVDDRGVHTVSGLLIDKSDLVVLSGEIFTGWGRSMMK